MKLKILSESRSKIKEKRMQELENEYRLNKQANNHLKIKAAKDYFNRLVDSSSLISQSK